MSLPPHPVRPVAPDPGRPDGVRGRGASTNIGNRFEPLWSEPDPSWTEGADPAPTTRFFHDDTQSIIARNDSPDVGFDVSFNPYRGCEHGCIYCYARPTHEYLGWSAGLDFESRILVKRRAPELLRQALLRPSWQPQVLAASGVTDCYQPIERRLQLTRQCLAVLAEFRHPVAMITKSTLVTRDLDLLRPLAAVGAAAVTISLTTLSQELSLALEPRAAVPQARLEAVRQLAQAGIPVGVNCQPIIPGLTDHELPQLLQAAAAAGAQWAGYGIVRLPSSVAPLFLRWLEEHVSPATAGKVRARIEEIRDGKLNDARFATRRTGVGIYARQLEAVVAMWRRRFGLDQPLPPLSTAAFRRPGPQQQSWWDVPG